MTRSVSAAQPRFLMVDDNPMFADMVARVAEEQGFDVVVTGNAEDFQTAFHKDRPALLGLDLVMPGTDGIELLCWLCGLGSKVPALVFSGKQPVYLKAAKALVGAHGAFAVETFGKPLDLSSLQETLRRYRVRCLAESGEGPRDVTLAPGNPA